MCINIHTLQALKTGFQCAKWIHICDTCTGQVFAEGFLSWIFTTISNGGNGYTGSPNKKTGIGLVRVCNGSTNINMSRFKGLVF